MLIRQRLLTFNLMLTSASALLWAATLAWPNWIELLFDAEPDAASGALERAISSGVVVATLIFLSVSIAAVWLPRQRHQDVGSSPHEAP